MKKLLITLVTVFTMISLGHAQQQIGIKGAFHLSNMAVDKDQILESNNKGGFSIGLINRTEKGFMLIQTELLWSRKGAKYDLADVTNTSVNANLDYIEIPVSFGIKVFESPLSIYGGVYGAYLINAKYEYKDSAENTTATYDQKDRFNKLDFGAQLGFQIKIDNLLLDARYQRGLRNVENDDVTINNTLYLANDTKNFNFQVSAGFLF